MCTATSGEYGMCLPESECIARRGILGGSCAQGYGICCICKHYRIYGFLHSYGLFCCCCFLVMASCGEIVRENGTYFVNPNHPNQVHSIFYTLLKYVLFKQRKLISLENTLFLYELNIVRRYWKLPVDGFEIEFKYLSNSFGFGTFFDIWARTIEPCLQYRPVFSVWRKPCSDNMRQFTWRTQ